MKLDDAFRDRQSETGAAGIARARGAATIEAVENMFEILRGNAAPRVPNFDTDLFAVGKKFHRNRALGRSVSQSVLDQILENPSDEAKVGTNKGKLWVEISAEQDSFFFSGKLEILHNVLNQLGKRKRLHLKLDLT